MALNLFNVMKVPMIKVSHCCRGYVMVVGAVGVAVAHTETID